MVKLIVGEKGTGKTKRLVDDLNEMAQENENNVICIQKGDRLNSYVDYNIRMIDIEEYPVETFSELLAFIAGINAKDYDVSHVYVDSITKVVKDAHSANSHEEFAQFLAALEGFAEMHHFEVTIMYSFPLEEIGEDLQHYLVK